jgi:hypothetical protein
MVFCDVKRLSSEPIFIKEEDTLSGLRDHTRSKRVGIRGIIKTYQWNFQTDPAP